MATGLSQQLIASLVPQGLGAIQAGQRGVQQNVLNQQGIELGQQRIDENALNLAREELVNKGQAANALLTADNPQQLRSVLLRMAQDNEQNPQAGIDNADLIDMANRSIDEQGFNDVRAELESDLARIQDINQAIDNRFGGSVRVQSSQILDDGTTIQVLSDGSTRVLDAAGTPLEGAARSEAIQKGQQFGIDIASQKAGGRQRDVDIEKLRTQIRNETTQTLRSAPPEIRKLRGLEKVFERADTGTGQAFLAALGNIVPGASNASLEDALSAAGGFVLNALGQIKGPITEKELAFIQTLGPSIRNSPEGNRRIIARAIKSLQDQLDLAKAQRAWVNQGNNPEDFDVEGFILEREAQRDEILTGSETFTEVSESGVTQSGIEFTVTQ